VPRATCGYILSDAHLPGEVTDAADRRGETPRAATIPSPVPQDRVDRAGGGDILRGNVGGKGGFRSHAALDIGEIS